LWLEPNTNTSRSQNHELLRLVAKSRVVEIVGRDGIVKGIGSI